MNYSLELIAIRIAVLDRNFQIFKEYAKECGFLNQEFAEDLTVQTLEIAKMLAEIVDRAKDPHLFCYEETPDQRGAVIDSKR